MQRYVANLMQNRFFICNVKTELMSFNVLRAQFIGFVSQNNTVTIAFEVTFLHGFTNSRVQLTVCVTIIVLEKYNTYKMLVAV